MPCYHPLSAWRRNHAVGLKSLKGKYASLPMICFTVPKGCASIYSPQQLPCGQCVGCRLERSRQWAMRCEHERQLHARNCFITLTFNDVMLPANYSLERGKGSVFEKFMKRLRNRFGKGVRFYMCGEYGEKEGRPHYHAILFNCDFSDKVPYKRTGSGHMLYTSKILDSLWTCPDSGQSFGYAIIGDVTFESSAYVARYIMKKVTGDMAEDHYDFVHPDTGEVFRRIPEFNNMSRMPGIGKGWFDKYRTDVFPRDYVVINGKKVRPPKYYDRQYEILLGGVKAFEPGFDRHRPIVRERQNNAKKGLDDCTPDRLYVRETCAIARLNQHKRGVDNET